MILARRLALAAGSILLASFPLRAQQPYAYPAPQYQQPQYQQPAPQYPNQPVYAQPQYQPAAPQQDQYGQPQDQYGQAQDNQDYDALDQMNGAAASAAPSQQPLSADQLEQLLAPVALYPDSLLAQVLAASTYPAEISAADEWLSQMRAQGYDDPNQIVAGADAQTGWDPSVKALTAFPQVLDMLNQNLEWTTDLGNAYYNQPQDVMQTIQVLRSRAQQAGTLQSSPQEQVTEDQGNIDLAPATPDVAYVPAYNPWAVYGAPVAPYPGFSYSMFSMLGGFGAHFAYGGLQYGTGIGMGAFENAPWGWRGWGLNWLTSSVLFNHSSYYTNSRTVDDWGFPRGGPRAHGWNGAPGPGHPQPYTQADRFAGRGQPYPGQGNRFADGGGNSFNRGEPRPVFGNPRAAYPGEQAYNREPYASPARPQSYPGRSDFYTARPQTYAERPQYEARNYQGAEMYGRAPAYDYSNRPAQGYAGRPGIAYARPYQSYGSPSYAAPEYRSPQYAAPRTYASRPAEPDGYSFARNERSGASHFFGGGHESYSYRAPKNSYGGGHEYRSFGHEKAPRMPHGESHFGGGGHFSGGGHSGGGHRHFL